MKALKTLFQRPFSELNRKLVIAYLLFSLLGFLDSIYLTVQHYTGADVNCTVIHGCDIVLSSSYAALWGIPLALLGSIYYLIVFLTSVWYLDAKPKHAAKILAYLPIPAWIFSLWLLYLQSFVIKNFCQFCLISFVTSTLLFILALIILKQNKNVSTL